MEMNKCLILIFIMFLLIMEGCQNKKLHEADIVGKWKSQDSAWIKFNNDSTFSTYAFPAEFVLLPFSEYKNVRFNGNGKWIINNPNSNFEIYLDFDQVSDPKCNSAFHLQVSGTKGLFG